MKKLFSFLGMVLGAMGVKAADLKEGSVAPDFTVKTHEGKTFQLSSRKGQWTVLYFYPKADTPGCTKQACAFRDSIDKIRKLNAEIFGISVDTVADQAAFHKKYHLNFTLLADEDAKVTEAYGAKMPALKMAKRWTFIIDPNLVIRNINQGADPVKDPDNVATIIASMRKK